MTQREWHERAIDKGTSGDMVFAILTDWQAEISAQRDEKNRVITKLQAEIAEMRSRISAIWSDITHCDNCGASWYDDGLTGRCPMCRIAEKDVEISTMKSVMGSLLKQIEQRDARIREFTEALEKIRLWCEGSTCEICGEKEMKDTDCYDYVRAAIGGDTEIVEQAEYYRHELNRRTHELEQAQAKIKELEEYLDKPPGEGILFSLFPHRTAYSQ